MADWRALAAGIETGQKLGTAMAEKKGRGLYGDVMAGNQSDSYSATGIPMPGQPGAEGQMQSGGTQDISYEGPTLKGQMAQLAEAYRLGGIDEDQFHTGVQNIGMRSYNGVKKNWDAFHAAQTPEEQQKALQELINMIPGSGMQYVMSLGDGTFATVPHDEDGQPIEGEQGLVLTPEMIDVMVEDATKDPNQWFRLVGMSTMELADLESKEVSTAISKRKEARDTELHPLEMGVKKSQIAKNQASAAKSYADAKGTSKTDLKTKDRAAINRAYLQELDDWHPKPDLQNYEDIEQFDADMAEYKEYRKNRNKIAGLAADFGEFSGFNTGADLERATTVVNSGAKVTKNKNGMIVDYRQPGEDGKLDMSREAIAQGVQDGNVEIYRRSAGGKIGE